jgi:fibronectin-binding autotransporter adhesin
VKAAGFDNTGGTLNVGALDTADFRGGIAGSFRNLDSTGTLNGGTYNIAGTFAYDAPTSSLTGPGNGQILELNGANITLNSGGRIVYGGMQGGTGRTDALANLNNITANDTVGNASLNLNGYNLSLAGGLTNQASGNATAVVSLSGGSHLAVNGLFNNSNGTLTLADSPSAGPYNTVTALGLANTGTLNVGTYDTADFRTTVATMTGTTPGTNTFTNLDSTATATGGTLTGGTYNISGTFNYDATTGTGGGQILALQGANITLNGTGQVLYGPGMGSDALAALTTINDSTLSYNNAGTKTIAPAGGALTINNDQVETSSLNLNNTTLSIRGGGLTLGIAGALGRNEVNLTASNLMVDGNITTADSSFGNSIHLNSDGATASSLTDTTGALSIGLNGSVVLNGAGSNGVGNLLTARGLTNNGIITLNDGDTADFRGPSGTGQLTNLVGGTLSGGTNGAGYYISNFQSTGGLFYGTGYNGSTGSINKLNGITMQLTGTGSLFYGTGAGTDALANLAALTGNTMLTLNGQTRTFNPNGANGTFDITSSMLGLNGAYSPLGAYTPTTLTIQGGLNVGNAMGSFGNVSISGGSALNVTNVSGGTGLVTINSGGSINIFGGGTNTLTGAALTNNGSLNVGAGDTATFSTLNSLNGGTLSGGSYVISGNLLYTGGADAGTSIQKLSNASVTLVGAGTISSDGGMTNALSHLSELSNSILTLNGSTTLTNINPGGTFTLGPAALNLNSASLTIGGAVNNTAGSAISLGNLSTLTIGGALANSEGSGVFLNGTGDRMTVTGQFSNSGSVSLHGNSESVTAGSFDNGLGGTFTVAGSNGSVIVTNAATNEGTLALNATGDTLSAASFDNAASGILTMDGLSLTASGAFTNEGALEVGSGGTLSAAGYAQNSGTTQIDSGGALKVAGGSGTVDLNGGTLAGGGTIDANVLDDGGILAPGDPQAIDIIGFYYETAAGMMTLDLASPSSFDHVQVGGAATLGGELNLTLEPGFAASDGTVFDVLDSVGTLSVMPSFDFVAPVFDGGTQTFIEFQNGNQLDLEVVATNTITATPEPSTLAMMLCFVLGAGVTWKVRGRRRNILKHSTNHVL